MKKEDDGHCCGSEEGNDLKVKVNMTPKTPRNSKKIKSNYCLFLLSGFSDINKPYSNAEINPVLEEVFTQNDPKCLTEAHFDYKTSQLPFT